MRKTIAVFAGLLLTFISITAFAEQAPFVEGQDYTLIVPAQPGGGQNEVTVEEFFMYTCPACFRFEPLVQQWSENVPAYVIFKHVPLATENSRPVLKLHAQAFYTAKQLGVLDQTHRVLFNLIHIQHEVPDSMDEMAKLFNQAAGVDKETFNNTMNSFAVNSQLRRSGVLLDRYNIKGTPAMVVNGKYRVMPGRDGAGSYKRVLQVVDYLIAREMSAD